jgi:Mce-associated membrane protein
MVGLESGLRPVRRGSSVPRWSAAFDERARAADRGVLAGGRRVRVAGVLGAVLVVLLVGVAAQTSGLVGSRAAAEAGGTGVDAAAQSVATLLSYDAGSIADTSAAIAGLTTGGFRDDFTALFDTVVTPNAVEQKASSTATVVARSLVSATPDETVALLFINQSTVSKTIPGERIDTIEARVSMQRVDGTWLVSGLDQV